MKEKVILHLTDTFCNYLYEKSSIDYIQKYRNSHKNLQNNVALPVVRQYRFLRVLETKANLSLSCLLNQDNDKLD